MKVLVTGAAGRIGGAVGKYLHQAGFEVVATDRRPRKDYPLRIDVGNLLDRYYCYRLMDGVDAVVHFANHPNAWSADPQTVFNENLTVNMNIFQAAMESGIQKILFASSIQAIHGNRNYNPDGEQIPSALPYLPIDSDTPANPGNIYGASKVASEQLLQYFAKFRGLSAVALRLPGMIAQMEPPKHHHHFWFDHVDRYTHLDEVFSYLSFQDAARLVEAILKTNLPGFRIYLPTAAKPWYRQPIPEVIAKYFPNVLLKKPLGEMNSLSDNSKITAETGWSPQDVLWAET